MILPTGLINVDTVVEIISGAGTSNKVIHVICTSGNVFPYRWEYTYWQSGAQLSGWITFKAGFNPNLPSGVTPTTLTYIRDGDVYYAVPQGTPIKANSQFVGDGTAELVKLEIDTDDYYLNPSTNLAPEYDDTVTYNEGDIVVHLGKIYSCNTNINVAEAWNSSHWTLGNIATLVLGMLNTGY